MTLDSLTAKLRDTTVDILYLVCHGRYRSDAEPELVLQGGGDDGTKHRVVSGSDFSDRLNELDTDRVPRLIVMASCESARKGGPRTTHSPLASRIWE